MERSSRSMASDVASQHEPVLLAETMESLAVRPGGMYVDGTVGLGGHADALLRLSAPDGRLLAVDRDAESLELARARLAFAGPRARFAQADFREIPALLESQPVHGMLLDLGVSSAQLDQPERGFSFRADGPLDMRMDRTGGETAAEVVNRRSEQTLADIFHRYGEEPSARSIARAIVAYRRRERITSTLQLAAIVRGSARGYRRPGLDAATRAFQALRIHVNRELEGLGAALAQLAGCLAPGGRLAVIAFHSLEDREVKQTFVSLAREGFRLLAKKPIRPQDAETARNPRARSARLRALERCCVTEGP
jgi:16S rRNA (cytosine1402-N4)-methyltransferase